MENGKKGEPEKEIGVSARAKEDIIKKNLPHINRANFIIRSVYNPIRQQIIGVLLSNGKLTVGGLCKATNTEQSVMSQHLSILRKAKLVIPHRAGKYIFYSADEKQLNAIIQFICKISND